MKILLSTSAKNLGLLYHKTSISVTVEILRSGDFLLAAGGFNSVESRHQAKSLFFASLTRSRTGKYHYGEDGSKTGQVILTLDGNRLSDKYKIKPVDYWMDSAANVRKEAEERLLSNERVIHIRKYIKRIDIIVPAHLMYNGKYTGTKERLNSEGRGLSTIVMLAKKFKIPYSFYHDTKSWSVKRNEFYPTSMLPARTKKNNNEFDYIRLSLLLKALTTDPEDFDKDMEELCRYPTEAWVTFNNNTTTTTGAASRALVDKISRVLKRLGVEGADGFKAALESKYKAAAKHRTRAEGLKRADIVAKSVINLLTAPSDSWTAEERSWLDPRFEGMTDTKLSYYLERAVEDYGHSPLTKRAFEALKASGARFPLDVNNVLDIIRARME